MRELDRELRGIVESMAGGERRTIQRFEVIELLGEGGMGAVYRAHDPQLQRDVAIKVLGTAGAPSALSTHQTIDLRRAAAPAPDDLLAEARVMARLSHPNVLPVYEVGLDEVGGGVFLVMEHIAGADLRSWLASRPAAADGPAARTAEIVGVFVQAAAGLAAAHAEGIVHRDLKPDNLLIGDDGRVRVADFGLSRIVQPSPDAMVRIAEDRGTPEYMAPELWRGEPATARSDVFALCVTFVEAVVGERLDPGPATERALRDRGVAPRLAELVVAGLAEDPAARPELARLVGVLAGARPRRRPWIAAVAAGALVGGGVAAYALVADADGPACTDDRAILVARWDAARRAELAAKLAPTSAPASASMVQAASTRILATLDDHADAIVRERRATCASVARGELTSAQGERRSSCLERRAYELGAIVTRMLAATRWDLAAAEAQAHYLPSLAWCDGTSAPPLPADRARAVALHERLVLVHELPKAERIPEAEAIERDAVVAGEEEVAARSAITLGVLQRNADQIVAGDAALQRGYRRAVDLRNDDLAAIALLERSNLASRNGDASGARSIAALALELADRPTTGPRTRARVYGALGRADRERGDLLSAVDRLRKGLAFLEGGGPHLQRTAIPLRLDLVNALANLEGKLPEAIALARDTVELARTVLGEHAADYGTAVNLLALALRLAGKLDESIPHRRKALEIVGAALPPDHSRVILQRTDLAADLQARGDHAEAYREFARALALCETNPAMAAHRPSMRSGLAVSAWGLGKHVEAADALEQAVAEQTSLVGQDHPKTLRFLRGLVDMELDLDRLDAAAKHLDALRRGYAAREESTDTRMATLRGTLVAQLALARGAAAEAEDHARRALAELAELKSTASKHVILRNLGASLARQRRWGPARAALDEALSLADAASSRADTRALIELELARLELQTGRRAAGLARGRRVRDTLAAFPGQPKARREVAALLAAGR